MSQVALTSLVTVLSGTLVFVLGQVVMVLFIERIRIQARTIEAIAQALVIHAGKYTTPWPPGKGMSGQKWERLLEASVELRKLAAVLRASVQTLRWYPLFERLRLVLPRQRLMEASKSLIGLSNLIPPQDTEVSVAVTFRKEIETLLGIDIST